jgi:hypothetical protein
LSTIYGVKLYPDLAVEYFMEIKVRARTFYAFSSFASSLTSFSFGLFFSVVAQVSEGHPDLTVLAGIAS